MQLEAVSGVNLTKALSTLSPMDRLRETINENEFLNVLAHRVRSSTLQIFLAYADLNINHTI